MHRITTALATIAVALVLPASASAHVTLQPDSAPAAAFTVENVRVPNERDDASTVKLDLRLPPGFAFASYEAKPGWKVKVVKEKLTEPIKTDDGAITEQIRRITWTGDGEQGRIAPGQFADFPLSVQVPGKEGDTLTFKAVQTYSNGEVVRWIGAPDAEEPAPQVAVTAAEEQGHGAAKATPERKPPATGTASTPAATANDDGPSTALVVIALALGGLGLVTGVGALMAARRRTATTA